MHHTITTAMVALVFAFVFISAVAFGFAARQCWCRCFNLGLPGGVGEESSPAGAECFFFFPRCPKHATAVQKLDLAEADKIQHQIYAFHFVQSSRNRCTQVFIILLMLWCECKAHWHVNCSFSWLCKVLVAL